MIVTINGIPVYEAVIGDHGQGMLRISLVDSPAVMSDFQAFAAERAVLMYRVADEEQRRVIGVVMRADFPIYRRGRNGREYYIIYKADTIAAMAEKYLLESRQNDVNLGHDPDRVVTGVNMVQYFIKGRGISPEGFDDIADGSLFAEFHVTNNEVWSAIKDGTYKGFSLEGVFDLVPETDESGVRSIVDKLEGKFAKIFNKKDMSKIKDFFKAIEAAVVSLQFGSISTDKGVLSWDGDDDLTAGDLVYSVDENGNRIKAADGEYRTEDGKVIAVADGAVAEIRDDDAEVAPEGDEPNDEELVADRQSFRRIVAQMAEQTYEERYRAIYNALLAAGYEYPYIVEATDEWAVIEDETGRFIRIAIAFAEDGTVTLGEATEVKRMFVPLDYESPFEDNAGIAEAVDAAEELSAIRSELSAIRSELASFAAAPAADPAHTEFTRSASAPAAVPGDRGLSNLINIIKAQ